MWIDHSLVALTLSHTDLHSDQQTDQQSILYLSTFEPHAGSTGGSVIAMERLATLRSTWWQERTCQLAAVKGSLVAVFGGTVLSCDRTGKIAWVRRQEWISPQDDRDWARQYQAPPLAWHDRLYVTQPGVADVECIDAESGELVWRKVLPGLKRLIGIVDDRLVVDTESGLIALAPDKGNVLWYHDMGDLLEGQLCGGPGKLLYTRREKVPGNDTLLRPVLVWLDPATGTERATVAIDSLKHDHPMFGPFLTSERQALGVRGQRRERTGARPLRIETQRGGRDVAKLVPADGNRRDRLRDSAQVLSMREVFHRAPLSR